MSPDAQGYPTDAEFQAEVDRRNQLARDRAAAERAAAQANKPDQYHPVKTGDTFASIAEELNHEGEGDTLADYAHDGGVSNRELAARHSNMIRGANGKAENEFGQLIPVLGPDNITTKTKLIEGQSLLLPKGW